MCNTSTSGMDVQVFLWKGRHKVSLIDAEGYLPACYRYVELNPVHAGMVTSSVDYRWSSYRHNAEGESSVIVTVYGFFLAISPNVAERRHHSSRTVSRRAKR